MQSKLSLLEVVPIVLEVLDNIKNESEMGGDEYKSDKEYDYAPFYFVAFRSINNQDAPCVYELVKKQNSR